MMNIDLLINLIRSYECLYDKKHKSYKDVMKKENIWREISESVDATADECKAQFKKLKDRYGRERKTIKKITASGAGYTDDSSWPWYNDLQFLGDHMQQRKRECNFSGETSCKIRKVSESTTTTESSNISDLTVEFLEDSNSTPDYFARDFNNESETGPDSHIEEVEVQLHSEHSYETPSTSNAPTPMRHASKEKNANTVKLKKQTNLSQEIDRETLKVLQRMTEKQNDEDRAFIEFIHAEMKNIEDKGKKAILKKKIIDLVMNI